MFKKFYDYKQHCVQHVQEPPGTEEWLTFQEQLTKQHYQDLHDDQQNIYIEEILTEQDLYIEEYQAEMDKQLRLNERGLEMDLDYILEDPSTHFITNK